MPHLSPMKWKITLIIMTILLSLIMSLYWWFQIARTFPMYGKFSPPMTKLSKSTPPPSTKSKP